MVVLVIHHLRKPYLNHNLVRLNQFSQRNRQLAHCILQKVVIGLSNFQLITRLEEFIFIQPTSAIRSKSNLLIYKCRS